MSTRIGLGLSFLAVAVQWYAVAGFVAHAFTWWIKVHDVALVSAGIAGTVMFSVWSATAIACSLWAYDRLRDQRSRLKHAAQLTALAGLSGLLVFFGMASADIVTLVAR